VGRIVEAVAVRVSHGRRFVGNLLTVVSADNAADASLKGSWDNQEQTMKYMLMIFGDEAEWASMGEAEMQAIYAEHEALVGIQDGSVLRGWLPRRAQRLVESGVASTKTTSWSAGPKHELASRWNRSRRWTDRRHR
jgi:hypothetical protein